MRNPRLSSTKTDQAEDPINLTPLIDVVFVMLIIFILIVPMLELDHINLANSAAHDAQTNVNAQESSPVTIHVRKDDTIWYNHRAVSIQELLSLLREAKKRHPNRIPQLFQDKNAHFGTYQTVKNAVEIAGFEQLDVVLQPG